MKKFGWFLLSILPVIVFIMIQFAGTVVLMVWYMIRYGVEAGAQSALDNVMAIMVLTQVMTLFVTGLWYYFGVFRQKAVRGEKEKSPFSVKSLGGIFCIAIGAQCLIGLLLLGWSVVNPEQIEVYNQMIEESGIGELTILSAIATVIMAPIGEEIVCRGLTVEYLKRTGAGFWVINAVQALLFGIMHLNLVQGAYAFLVGLICGYLVLKYKNLLASMFFHGVFNAYSAFLTPAAERLEAMNPTVFYIGCLVVGAVMFSLGIWLMKKEFLKEEDGKLPGIGIGI